MTVTFKWYMIYDKSLWRGFKNELFDIIRAKYKKKKVNLERESNTGPQYKDSVIIRQTASELDYNFQTTNTYD